MFKKPQSLKGLTVNLVQGLFNNVPAFRFSCLFVKQNFMDSSNILWNKFQDYRLKIHFNRTYFGNNLTHHL